LRLTLADALIVPLRLADIDTDADAVMDAPVEERMSVGSSVGMTRALDPKKGAVSGSKRGPVSVCGVSTFLSLSLFPSHQLDLDLQELCAIAAPSMHSAAKRMRTIAAVRCEIRSDQEYGR
jgi:hypothetical protein